MVLLKVLHTWVASEDGDYGSREVAVEVNIPPVNEVDALRLEDFLDIVNCGILVNRDGSLTKAKRKLGYLFCMEPKALSISVTSLGALSKRIPTTR